MSKIIIFLLVLTTVISLSSARIIKRDTGGRNETGSQISTASDAHSESTTPIQKSTEKSSTPGNVASTESQEGNKKNNTENGTEASPTTTTDVPKHDQNESTSNVSANAKVWAGRISDSCETDEHCRVDGSRCKTNVCQCKDDFVTTTDDQKCLKKAESASDSCEEDKQCEDLKMKCNIKAGHCALITATSAYNIQTGGIAAAGKSVPSADKQDDDNNSSKLNIALQTIIIAACLSVTLK